MPDRSSRRPWAIGSAQRMAQKSVEGGGQLAIGLIEGVRFVGELYPQFVDTRLKIQGLLRPGSSSAARSVPEAGGLVTSSVRGGLEI